MPLQEPGSLRGRHVLLGITGGVAAYKTPELVRRLIERGAEVRVILSHTASQFVTALSLKAVGGQIVQERDVPMAHIELARWADVLLIAPATAYVLARLATGTCDDLLTTTVLATHAPVAVAPAMNQAMWRHVATQANQALLRERGTLFIGPANGPQACGDLGPGRMAEITDILSCLAHMGDQAQALSGVLAVVTAGPTYEALDPARGFTNRSSGKMGYAIADALTRSGAHVTLITGPTALPAPACARVIAVTSALEMHNAVLSCREAMELFVATAAVADYRPETTLAHKLKKGAETLDIRFVRNPDILAEVASWKPAPFTVGFAAETEHLETYGRKKLVDKGLDLVVANPVGEPGAGFEADWNRVTLIDKAQAVEWVAAPKADVARMLVTEIIKRLPRSPHS